MYMLSLTLYHFGSFLHLGGQVFQYVDFFSLIRGAVQVNMRWSQILQDIPKIWEIVHARRFGHPGPAWALTFGEEKVPEWRQLLFKRLRTDIWVEYVCFFLRCTSPKSSFLSSRLVSACKPTTFSQKIISAQLLGGPHRQILVRLGKNVRFFPFPFAFDWFCLFFFQPSDCRYIIYNPLTDTNRTLELTRPVQLGGSASVTCIEPEGKAPFQ